MAGIVGSTGPLLAVTSIAIPAGSVAGQLAILWDDLKPGDSGKPGDGWSSVGHKSWSRRLTADDIAAGTLGPCRGSNSFLIVLSLAGGVGRVRDSVYARLAAGGVGIWLGWMTPYHSAALASATYQRGATVKDPFDLWRHGAWARAVATAGDYEPGSVSRYTDMYSIAVLPLAAPSAPGWVSGGGTVDRTQATRLVFEHKSGAEVGMDRYRGEIRVSGGTWQHVAADGTIVATAQEIAGSAPILQIAQNQLATNTSYEVRVYSHDDGGWSVASASLTLTARTPPTVVPVLTTAHGDVSPLVSWTTTPGLGAQKSWEARICADGQAPDGALAGWASGVHAGTDTSWQAPSSTLPVNGGQYVAWVRVWDDALPSVWVSSAAKTISWTPPTAPAAVVAAEGHPPTVTASGVPSTSLALEWQQKTAGGEWVALTVTDGPAGSETNHVPLAPYGVSVSYRVRSIENIDGARLPSGWTESAPFVSHDTSAYLVSPDGIDWLMVRIVSDGGRSLIQGVAPTQGVGATAMHVQRTLPAGTTGTTVMSTWTQAELAGLVGWVTGRAKWWLRWPPERENGGLADTPPTLMGLGDTASWQRKVQTNTATREVTVKWVEQEA